jgi:hypothetical protein
MTIIGIIIMGLILMGCVSGLAWLFKDIYNTIIREAERSESLDDDGDRE